jgi:nitroreductase
MQLVAWANGIGSRNYTGYDESKMRAFINAPSEMTLVAVLGFGYPAKKLIGKKNRLPLDQIAFHEKYSESISKL